jgi:hypothetical protein
MQQSRDFQLDVLGQITFNTNVPSQQQPSSQYGFSRIILIGSFVFIGVMLFIHYITLENLLNSQYITDKNSTAIKELIDHVNTSNQTVFNILLPVFGAWVDVVVAFYFSSEQEKNTHDILIKKLSPDEEKLSTSTNSTR